MNADTSSCVPSARWKRKTRSNKKSRPAKNTRAEFIHCAGVPILQSKLCRELVACRKIKNCHSERSEESPQINYVEQRFFGYRLRMTIVLLCETSSTHICFYSAATLCGSSGNSSFGSPVVTACWVSPALQRSTIANSMVTIKR